MADEQSRITVTISDEASERIETLAERMQMSPSRMASLLLEAGLDDHEWMIKLVSSHLGKKLREGFGMLSSKKVSKRTAKGGC